MQARLDHDEDLTWKWGWRENGNVCREPRSNQSLICYKPYRIFHHHDCSPSKVPLNRIGPWHDFLFPKPVPHDRQQHANDDGKRIRSMITRNLLWKAQFVLHPCIIGGLVYLSIAYNPYASVLLVPFASNFGVVGSSAGRGVFDLLLHTSHGASLLCATSTIQIWRQLGQFCTSSLICSCLDAASHWFRASPTTSRQTSLVLALYDARFGM